ncbi:hypothetical protein [Spirosoma areae]
MKRIAIFADGCFWHGHDCRNTKPSANKAYWDKKIERNKNRDALVTERLKQRGWTVFRIWECDISKRNIPIELLKLLQIPTT